MKKELKGQALFLRTKENKSLNEICKQLSISKGTASLWLKGYQLPKKILKEKIRRGLDNCHKSVRLRIQKTVNKLNNSSKIYQTILRNKLSPLVIGKISEAVVLLRLLLHGFEAYSSPFDSERVDFIVRKRKINKLIKIQVKTIQRHRKWQGAFVSLWYSRWRAYGKISNKDFDYIVGYDLYTDKCYVFSKKQICLYKSIIPIKKGFEEGWDKIV